MVGDSHKELIVIAGPTASGKTALAVNLAQKLETSILSADSRQCFKELSIGVAKPTEEEMQGIPHFFIDSHAIADTVNAGMYEEYGLNILQDIFSKKDCAILVGGTGLYIKAICEGLDNMPSIPNEIRENIIDQYKNKGLSWLQNEVMQQDFSYWNSTAEKENPQRLMRALEVSRATGKSILDFRSQTEKKRDFTIKKFAIEWPRQELYDRINHRVDLMIQNGLVEEVKNLIPYQHLNALQTVGYTEIFDFLDGKTDLATAIDKIKSNTRHYAKRQMTWFKKDPDIVWISPNHFEDFLQDFTP